MRREWRQSDNVEVKLDAEVREIGGTVKNCREHTVSHSILRQILELYCTDKMVIKTKN